MESKKTEKLRDYFYSNEKDLIEQIKKAKLVYDIIPENKYNEDDHITGKWIPFNLERKYFDILIEERRYKEAKCLLKQMRASYFGPDFHNFIEQYEYILISITHLDKEIKDQIIKAKDEFNKHTITLITVIVGLITVFGVANNTLIAESFNDGLVTFLSISAVILLLISITSLIVNKKSNQ